MPETRYTALGLQVAPDQTRERGQFRVANSLDHPELELSNNVAENSMRPIALGRGNWIHIGSETAGPRVAAIISVIESCRRLKIPVRNYLAEILPGLANAPVQRIAELTPAAWAAKNALV